MSLKITLSKITATSPGVFVQSFTNTTIDILVKLHLNIETGHRGMSFAHFRYIYLFCNHYLIKSQKLRKRMSHDTAFSILT